MGGLGNKLFQVAAGMSHAIKTNKTLVLVFQNELRGNYRDTIFRDFISGSSQVNCREYIEPTFEYREIGSNYDCLMGYFQSLKYFENIQNDVRLTFTRALKSDRIIPIDNTVKIAIHIRRGDYLQLPDYHPVLGLDYYQEAIQMITKNIENYSLIIFSDDHSYCRVHFKNAMIIQGTTDIQDLYNLSLCNHFIIANSSFSWWGAFLSLSPNKKIIAPKKWFGIKGPRNWQDLYTNDMQLV